MSIQEKLDYLTVIYECAKAGIVPEHDCQLSPEDGCSTCEDYFEACNEISKYEN